MAPGPDSRDAWEGYGTAWSIIGTILAGLAVWGAIGFGLDRLVGFRAVFLPIGLILAGVAFGAGLIVGPGVGVSAAIGVLAVLASFVANALALGWARTVSLTAIQAVAFGGFLVRLGFVAGVFLVLKASASWFSPPAFGAALMTMIPIALYEAYL